MANKSRLVINLEYYTVRSLCGVVNSIPYPLALSMARGLAWVVFRVFGLKRKRTLARIHEVFPEKSRKEANAIAVSSLANMFQIGVEVVRAPHFDRAWMDKYVREGLKYKNRLQEYIDEGKGVVIMVPHTGNWFMAMWSMCKYGLPLVGIGSRQRNPKLNAWLYRQYGDAEVLDRDSKDTLPRIRKALANGRAFAIQPDLRVRKPDIEVDFLRGKANVSHAGAAFAVHCGCPIVVAMMRRDGNTHVFEHMATLRPDPNATNRKEEETRIMRETMKILDEGVRRYPGDWFWFNKRWILEPPEK